jgi:hypothetical protein
MACQLLFEASAEIDVQGTSTNKNQEAVMFGFVYEGRLVVVDTGEQQIFLEGSELPGLGVFRNPFKLQFGGQSDAKPCWPKLLGRYVEVIVIDGKIKAIRLATKRCS